MLGNVELPGRVVTVAFKNFVGSVSINWKLFMLGRHCSVYAAQERHSMREKRSAGPPGQDREV